MESLADFSATLRTFIRESLLSEEGSDSAFPALALRLFALQYAQNEPYRRLCQARGVAPGSVTRWEEIPAVPAAAFKELPLTCLTAENVTVEFLSSGTTMRERSRHLHGGDSLAVYETSLLPWFERHVLDDMGELVEDEVIGPLDKLPMLFLTPDRVAAPNSSLVYMFDAILREHGARDSLFAGRVDPAWQVEVERALFAIRKSMCANRPLAILGTAFNFVHLLDHFVANNMRYRLARGSRVVETGGYKGQSREVPRAELHALITKHLGISPEYIVTEFGMCELSSQAYNRRVGQLDDGEVFRFPPWARARVISPETGGEVGEGETGLLRITDLANVYSVQSVQTEDLAVRRGRGFELIGRATRSAAKGCSLYSA